MPGDCEGNGQHMALVRSERDGVGVAVRHAPGHERRFMLEKEA